MCYNVFRLSIHHFCMKKILFSALAVFMLIGLVVPTAHAADETLVFDSTDTYLGACNYTDTSEWTLTQDLAVSKFQLWYKWQTNETTLPVTVTKDGQPFATFTATRGDCDPYQASWCNADYDINKTLPAGTYTTKIDTNQQCLKPGGTGTVRLYTTSGTTAAANVNSATNTNASANTNRTAVTNENTSVTNTANVATTTETTTGTCSTTGYIIIAILVVIIFALCAMLISSRKKLSR